MNKALGEFAAAGISTLDDLKDALQLAIQLEFATLPPYLCAEWSIKKATDPDKVVRMLRRITLQEMLHFALNCNILSAIGGTPDIAIPSFVPAYPTNGLPGGVHRGLIVDLVPLNRAALNTFMQIEYPQNGPIARFAMETATIGQFYSEIIAAITSINPPFLPNANQVVGQIDGLTEIKSAADAISAINLIVEQGEGTSLSVEEPGFSSDHPAHFYSFAQIAHGRALIQLNGKWEYAGPPIQMPDSFAFNAPDSGEEFAITFSDLLRSLDACWRSKADIDLAIDQMFTLSTQGMALIQAGIRPSFRWTNSTRRTVPMSRLSIAAAPLVSFSRDILPLFSSKDIQHMDGYGVYLDSYAYMADPTDNYKNAEDVLAFLKGTKTPRMPVGGPYWTSDQLELFAKWMADGYSN